MSLKAVTQIPGDTRLSDYIDAHRRRLQLGDVMLEQSRKHGDIVRLPMPGGPRVLLSHPDDVQDVLAAKAQYFGLFGQNLLKVLFPWGLVATEGQIHDENRALMLMAMRKMQSRINVNDSLARCRQIMSTLRDGQVVDLYQVARDLTYATAVNFVFPPAVRSKILSGLHHEEFLRVISQANLYFLALPKPLKLIGLAATILSVRKTRKLKNRMLSELQRIISEFRPDVEQAPFHDVLSLLVDGSEIGGAMNPLFLVDNIVALLLAGYETTANTIAWALWEATRQPALQDSIAGEGHQLADNPDEGPSWMNRALWTDATLRESERLYPSIWALARHTLSDYQIRGYLLPAGTAVYVSQWVTHRDPRWFPDPDSFIPSRWIEDRHRSATPPNGKGASPQRPTLSFFPFGGGKRFCIGRNLFDLEASIMLATFLAELKLTPVSDVQVRPRFLVTTQPESQMLVRVQRR